MRLLFSFLIYLFFTRQYICS